MNYTKVSRAASLRSARIAADIQTLINNRSYYKFQYTPLTGPLPGLSFEQQTEDAINDIGNMSYGSYEIATQALTTANQAYNAAQSAIEIANHAETTAQNAQTTANNAAKAAAGAQKTADNAAKAAADAQKTADNAAKAAAKAQETADNAQSSANTAIATATDAQTTADNAQNDATSALNRLDSLTPVVEELRYYDNIDTAVDLNDKTEFARELLEASNNTNAPETGSGWLDVDDDFNETYIRQKFMGQASGKTYVRFGTIVPDSDPVTVSEWSNWVEYTLKSDLDNTTTDLTEKINTVATDLAGHEADYNNPHKVTAEQLGLTTVYQYKGSVATYADLPTTGQKVGDVWNIETADPDHGIKAGDNVAWDGTQWDILGGNHDLSGYATLAGDNDFAGTNTFGASTIFNGITQVKNYLYVRNSTNPAGAAGRIVLGYAPDTASGMTKIEALATGKLTYTTLPNLSHEFLAGDYSLFSIAGTEASSTLTLGGKSLAESNATGISLKNILAPTADSDGANKKYVDDAVAAGGGAGGGDVTAAGNNNFTGVNTFNNSTNFGSYIAVRSGDGSSASGVINLGRLSGSTVQGASLSAISTGQLNLTAGTGRNVVLQSREQQDAVNLAEFSTSQAIIYPNVLTIGMGSSGTVAMERGTKGDYRLHLVDNDVIVAGFNSNSNVAAFSAHQIIFNSDGVSEEWKLRNNTATILDYDGIAMHLRTGNSNVGLELGPGTSGWALQCPSNSTDVRVARRLYVGSQGGTGNGVISADNTENCLYFCGTAENVYYSTPNTGNTISYQAAANVYLINTSINDAASLTMNFSNMSFHATVGSTPYMCKTLTFWFATGATAPTVTWQFPSGAAVYYPKGVAPALTANASNIINVVAIVDDTDSFSIQVCDVVALPYSG